MVPGTVYPAGSCTAVQAACDVSRKPLGGVARLQRPTRGGGR